VDQVRKAGCVEFPDIVALELDHCDKEFRNSSLVSNSHIE
jgi:hypothetical protein